MGNGKTNPHNFFISVYYVDTNAHIFQSIGLLSAFRFLQKLCPLEIQLVLVLIRNILLDKKATNFHTRPPTTRTSTSALLWCRK